MTLIELLVAMVIGLVLILGATQVYVDSRNAYTVNESTSRLQETARYAMSVIEPDVRMSNYWGLLKGSEAITGRASPTEGVAAVAGAAATVCGNNYGVDLDANLEGSNGSYALGCAAFNNNPATNSDTLTVRRAAANPSVTPPTAGPLRVCSTRGTGTLVNDTATAVCAAATAVPPTGQINDLIVHAYYVARDSAQQNGLPSLRRKALNATPTFQDDEIVPGVEDMQVQFGIDPSGGLGPNRGSATRYLNAGAALNAAIAAGAQIVSVRMWLLVRAGTPELGFTDDRIYEYGDRLAANGTTGDLENPAHATRAYQPSLNADNTFTSVKRFRRLLVSRTVQIRNALGT
jgi:type IV pilus assembly protein PilW